MVLGGAGAEGGDVGGGEEKRDGAVDVVEDDGRDGVEDGGWSDGEELA